MVHFQQKQVLAFRDELLATVQTSEDRENLDSKTFERLKHVSPEGLVPILIQRNHEDWIAAFLIQEVGLSSKRFLVKASTWRIQWAKKSAKLIRVPQDGKIHEQFLEIVRAQEERFDSMDKLQEMIKKNGNGQQRTPKRVRRVLRTQQKLVGTAS